MINYKYYIYYNKIKRFYNYIYPILFNNSQAKYLLITLSKYIQINI